MKKYSILHVRRNDVNLQSMKYNHSINAIKYHKPIDEAALLASIGLYKTKMP